MSRTAFAIIYLIVMIGCIVAVDLLFLRGHVDLRLVVNVALVALFGVGYILISRRRS